MPALTPVVARLLTKTKVFHEDDVYPPPLPVLLKDTDFPLPVFEAVYASTNIVLDFECPIPRMQMPQRTSRHGSRANTLYSSRPRTSQHDLRHSSPPQIPLPEQASHQYPPSPEAPLTTATHLMVARPNGAQKEYVLKLAEHLSRRKYDEIKVGSLCIVHSAAAFAVVAPDFLDMSVSFTKQDPGAMDRFKAKIYTQFPNLNYYEQDWALQGFTTDLLKRKKDAMRSLEKSTSGGRQSRAKNGTKK
ncbi:hypothetical protein R3P38DRAFT_3366782 [Favolaschia claudopus]|uniref:Uncharacterized protein n=1 Tax=Favolaschia claudopus TaxID=2862362 RepID=A0AAW0ADX5_9AGAR